MPNEFENIVEDIGHGIEVAAEDAAKVVTVTVTFAEKAAKVFEAIVTGEGQGKAILTQLATYGAAIGADTVAAIAKDGLSAASDATDAEAVVTLLTYFENTVMPYIETEYQSITAAAAE